MPAEISLFSHLPAAMEPAGPVSLSGRRFRVGAPTRARRLPAVPEA